LRLTRAEIAEVDGVKDFIEVTMTSADGAVLSETDG